VAIRLEHAGGVYEFIRRFDGEGRWLCIHGHCLGNIGSNCAGQLVPVMHSFELTSLAVEAGIASRADLARYVAKPEPKPRVKRLFGQRRPPRRRTGVVRGLSLFEIAAKAEGK
jgi:hypothetical protein